MYRFLDFAETSCQVPVDYRSPARNSLPNYSLQVVEREFLRNIAYFLDSGDLKLCSSFRSETGQLCDTVLQAGQAPGAMFIVGTVVGPEAVWTWVYLWS